MDYISGSDSYAEVFVGRFSAQNAIQLDTMINRTLNYEKNPDLSLNWYKKGLGIGSNEGGPGTEKVMMMKQTGNIFVTLELIFLVLHIQ